MSAAEARHYDAVVIGSGQGGNPLAQALAESGLRTALVEREHVGGTCINVGCTPTKTMIASGRVAYLARRGADYGVKTGPLEIEMTRVRERKRSIVAQFQARRLEKIRKTENLELIMGEASFTGPKRLLVERKDAAPLAIDAERVFINTGCSPFVPDIQGLREAPFLDSTSIMELSAVPPHLVVLGGGYVGLEFGQLFRRLGSDVTIIHSGAQLLAHEDEDVAKAVADILRGDGIEVLFEARAVSASFQGARVRVDMKTSGGISSVSGTHLLVATGRVPNTQRLGLPAAGIGVDPRGYVRVNDRLETDVPGVYALGDVKGGPAFTHISYDDFRILRTNLLSGGRASTAGRLLPYTVFIDPQLGRVGPTERELRAQGRDIKVATIPMSYVARALEVDETRGFMKAVVDPATKQILSATALGVEGGEIASQLQIAMMGRLPYTALRDGVFAHPTLAEALNNLFAGL